MRAEVLIVGAGPVGLSLGLGLARAGVDVVILEAEDDLQDDLRGGAFHPPTLEMFDRWGVLDDARAQGIEVRQLKYWDRRSLSCVGEFDYSLLENRTPFPFRLHCMQNVLCRILRDHFLAAGGRLFLNHQLVGVSQTADSVAAELVTHSEPLKAIGRWLFGADGARSTVRKLLRLSFEGSSHPDRFLVVNGDVDLQRVLPGFAPVNYVFDPDEWVIVLQLPGFARVAFRVEPGIDATVASNPRAVARRLQRLIQGHEFQVHSYRVYQVAERAASKFFTGRIALLGDAAHINNQIGGMGLNLGIHDADALITSLMGDGDLQAWADKRREVATRGILKQAASNLADLQASEKAAIRRRNDALHAAMADTRRAVDHLMRYSMLPTEVTS